MNLFLPNSSQFSWTNGELYCESVPLRTLAKEFGTPLYVYSYNAIKEAVERYRAALGSSGLLCYAMKANSNLAVIKMLSDLGTGFDIVSGGELARIIAAGANPKRAIFSGVAKTIEEIEFALKSDILCFNVESAAELERIISVAAKLGKRARISLRVNPNIDAKTHAYISTGLRKNKFGVPYEEAADLYLHAAKFPKELQITGMDCHIGSQITQIEPFVDACTKMLDLADKLKGQGINFSHLDFGGGLGINYEQKDNAPSASDLVSAIRSKMKERGYGKLKVIFEAGRSVVGNAGAMLMEIEYLKNGPEKNFCIVDAGMNDLIRPALYQAWMQIVPIVPRKGKETIYDVVGPVCESGDWLGKDRSLAVKQGDLLALLSAGAYGMTMSSHYNTRIKPAEIMVKDGVYSVIRNREEINKLYSSETLLPKDF